MTVIFENHPRFEASVQVLVVGAGACGLTAALAAHDQGGETLVLERDAHPTGSTAMSSGFIPAAGSRIQAGQGIDDSPQRFAQDIQKKAGGRADPVLVKAYTEASGPAVDWLSERHGLPFELLQGFLYPGHSKLRMHTLPEKSGEALSVALQGAVTRAGIDILSSACVDELFVADDGAVKGVRIVRPDGSCEVVGCGRLILACNGFGGNSELVRRYLPEMAAAPYFGHAGNTGDAVKWGSALGGELADMGAYQGHGSLATPQNILITWALMMEGAIQVNSLGMRFSNEEAGYSEQAVKVLGQVGGVAWNIYDSRCHELGMGFPDYKEAWAAGAIRSADSLHALAKLCALPPGALDDAIGEAKALAHSGGVDAFGRRFNADHALKGPPWYAVKVTGALFHTQGGLVVDAKNRVLRAEGRQAGRCFPNLYAAGGAARGVSGDSVAGYLSGNGLLSAIAGGYIAGRDAILRQDSFTA